MNKSKYIITIDTESDNAWNFPERIRMKNFEGIKKFQYLCEKYSIVPIYLLTYEYATNIKAIDFLIKKIRSNKCKVGYHFHVWSTPPFQNEKNGVDIDWLNAYQYELPDKLFYEKANTLYNTIVDNFNIKPIIHRAGRYGIDQRSIDWIIDKGFKVDTSVVPYINMSSNKGKISPGNDFISYNNEMFFWNHSKKNKEIIEIPVSTILPKYINNNLLYNKYIKKICNKFGYARMLRPYPGCIKINRKIINHLLSKRKIVNVMLHSSELTLNCSPYTLINKDMDYIWKAIIDIFSIIKDKNLSHYSINK